MNHSEPAARRTRPTILVAVVVISAALVGFLIVPVAVPVLPVLLVPRPSTFLAATTMGHLVRRVRLRRESRVRRTAGRVPGSPSLTAPSLMA